MSQTGLTATNLAADSKPAERTVPSPQPPSLLTSVSGVHRPPAGSGTMAPNDGPNGVAVEAVSSAPRGRDGNVSEVANGARRYGFPVVRPEVPECFPDRSPSLFPKQEWVGRVTAISNGTFDAHLRDLTAGGREVATIDLEEVSPEDRTRMRVGSLFHWVMGYETVSGTRSNVSRIVFLNAPRMTERDLKAGQEWADRLRAKWNLD